MLRRLFAALLLVHGLIHLIGFVVPWRIMELDGFPYTTTAFWDRLELGTTGAQLLGVAWLAIAVAFVVAGIGAWRGDAWAMPLAAIAALLSLPVCLLGSPAAILGVVVNALILIVVGVEARPSRRAASAWWTR